MREEITVLKFGSSVLRTDADLPNAVHEIYRWVRSGARVVAVVSAIGDATDRLLVQARLLSPTPEEFATAELLATGERASAALLGMALDRSGLPARVLNPREIGLTVAGSPLDSELVSVDVERLRGLLGGFPVLVVPGFFGTDARGRTHCLGRGGSDLTAVFLANTLNAHCRLVKDVDGVYDADPSAGGATRFESLSYADALRVAGPLIQPKAVTFLWNHGAQAQVAALARGYESTVHAGVTEFAQPATRSRPLKVVLLGLGTVGYGVYQRLTANAEHFECVGALVREPAKYLDLGMPANLLSTDLNELLAMQADVVVDALPTIEPSRFLASRFLRGGTSVVSANKTLIAEYGAELAAMARDTEATLHYSAAVGGGAPMIEAVSRAARNGSIADIAAVLNGTCNFVLGRCAAGALLEKAVRDAQRQGFAESDATDDLTGRDAVRKLRILARHAFGAELEPVEAAPLDERVAREAADAKLQSMALRQVARAWKAGGHVVGAVRFERFAVDNPFGSLTGEWNAIELATPDGRREYISGRGAGRWPTTEAIMADLFDLSRARFDRV